MDTDDKVYVSIWIVIACLMMLSVSYIDYEVKNNHDHENNSFSSVDVYTDDK